MDVTGEWTTELQLWLREQAKVAGFDTAGVASVDTPESSHIDAERFASWVAAGRAGEMEFWNSISRVKGQSRVCVARSINLIRN